MLVNIPKNCIYNAVFFLFYNVTRLFILAAVAQSCFFWLYFQLGSLLTFALYKESNFFFINLNMLLLLNYNSF